MPHGIERLDAYFWEKRRNDYGTFDGLAGNPIIWYSNHAMKLSGSFVRAF